MIGIIIIASLKIFKIILYALVIRKIRMRIFFKGIIELNFAISPPPIEPVENLSWITFLMITLIRNPGPLPRLEMITR